MKSTPKEVEEMLAELKSAMLENLEISQAESDVKIKKIASHYRLLKAREAVHALEFN